ncbi:hypothetical protein Tcan_04531 [Toxocara canis]|uniref:Uncharacterized protein n=1 Tax=Toxocara canis TaxID=6265 RepID=A0A0B2VGP6_TOXCA|nr:hypothetical protein Tcan_04531 [Toxocara canis]
MKQHASAAVPQRLEQLFDALHRGFSSYADFYASEVERLKAEIESRCEDAEQLKQFQDELMLAEENAQLYNAHAKRLNKLNEQYAGQLSAYKNAKWGWAHQYSATLATMYEDVYVRTCASDESASLSVASDLYLIA